jgi:hypothetical protein
MKPASGGCPFRDQGTEGAPAFDCTQKSERRTKPLRPPVRPLHRLEIGAQHTPRHLDSCPIMVVIDGPVRKAGHAGATAIDLGHIIKKEDGQLALHQGSGRSAYPDPKGGGWLVGWGPYKEILRTTKFSGLGKS